MARVPGPEHLNELDQLARAAQAILHRREEPLAEQVPGVLMAAETNQGIVEFDGRTQVVNASDMILGGRGQGLEMPLQVAVEAAPGVGVQTVPGDTAHDGMQVVAVGAAVPAEQATVLQLRQRASKAASSANRRSGPTRRAASVS